jgi:outer membrane protein TolC
LEKVHATEKERGVYEQTLASAEVKYREGIVSNLDVDDVRLGRDVASFNVVQATYDYLVARAEFYKAIGGEI